MEHAVAAPHVEKHDHVLVGATAFAMDIARWGGLVHPGGTDFFERAIKWNTLTLPPVGELKHLLFTILSVDEQSHNVPLALPPSVE
jgi:hypothetical protein